jgi:hypothetical protein
LDDDRNKFGHVIRVDHGECYFSGSDSLFIEKLAEPTPYQTADRRVVAWSSLGLLAGGSPYGLAFHSAGYVE